MLYYVYALVDPRNDAVVYIGMTGHLDERLKQHISCSGDSNEKKNAWIKELLEKEFLPIMKVLEAVDSVREAREYEAHWIRHYIAQQAPLVNRLLPAKASNKQVEIKDFEQVDVSGILSSRYYVDHEEAPASIERVQIGVRMEKRLVKVLKGLGEYHDLTLGDLLEGIVLHAFESRAPFNEESLRKIIQLKEVYGMDYGAEASHRLTETPQKEGRK